MKEVLNAFRQSEELNHQYLRLPRSGKSSAQRLSAIRGIKLESISQCRHLLHVLNAFRQSEELNLCLDGGGSQEVSRCSTPFGNQRN